MFANQTTREFWKKGVFEANMFDIKQFDYRACQPWSHCYKKGGWGNGDIVNHCHENLVIKPANPTDWFKFDFNKPMNFIHKIYIKYWNRK